MGVFLLLIGAYAAGAISVIVAQLTALASFIAPIQELVRGLLEPLGITGM